MRKYFSLGLTVALLIGATSCEKDQVSVDETLAVPTAYNFERSGKSSVSYSGQTDRLNQLTEMKTLLQLADAGSIVNEADLLAMYENTNGDGNGNFSFSSSKQLLNKTFDLDQTYFQGMLKSAAAASKNGNSGIQAAKGKSGLITRGSKNATILVDEKGFEFTQMFEKGLMGGVFYYQIVNVYLTDDKIGDAVDNVTVDTAKNYTDMEHHWDEAFGYFGAPVDFESMYTGTDSPRYWAKYSNTVDVVLSMNTDMMGAFKTGRTAIVANKHDTKLTEATKVNAHFNTLIAATAIHYANQAKAITDQGDLLHVLSECYAFTRALRYANQDNRYMTPSEVDALLTASFGADLWSITAADLDALITALSTTYQLDSYKDIL
jgi:hypothetical protein